MILVTHQEQLLGARRLEEIIEFKSCIRLSHNKIHGVLLKHGLAKEKFENATAENSINLMRTEDAEKNNSL